MVFGVFKNSDYMRAFIIIKQSNLKIFHHSDIKPVFFLCLKMPSGGHFWSILGYLELGFKITLPVVEYSISIIIFWNIPPVLNYDYLLPDVDGQHCPFLVLVSFCTDFPKNRVRCLSNGRILSGCSVRCLCVRILSVSILSALRILSGLLENKAVGCLSVRPHWVL